MVIVLEKRYRSYVRVGTDLSQLSLYSVWDPKIMFLQDQDQNLTLCSLAQRIVEGVFYIADINQRHPSSISTWGQSVWMLPDYEESE